MTRTIANTTHDSRFLLSRYVVNDSYRTDLCLLYPPYLIAIAALYVASVLKDRDKKPDVKQWFAELTVDMNDVRDWLVCPGCTACAY